jgi:hypothetical protein
MTSRSVGDDVFFGGIVGISFIYDWSWEMKTVGCFSDGTRTVAGDRTVRQHVLTRRERI